ncbi:hypothetical protein ACLB1N_01395 [Escherichia coli]
MKVARDPGAVAGSSVWGDIPGNSVQPGGGNGEPVTAEVLAQRQAEEAIRRERNAVRMRLSEKWQRKNLTSRMTKQSRLSGILPGRSVTGLSLLNGKPYCRRVCCVSLNGCGTVREVARENLLQERLQQMERDMVRDLQKEKTLGGD